eukprot:jgi/Chlat1/1670/Chrsp127S01905
MSSLSCDTGCVSTSASHQQRCRPASYTGLRPAVRPAAGGLPRPGRGSVAWAARTGSSSAGSAPPCQVTLAPAKQEQEKQQGAAEAVDTDAIIQAEGKYVVQTYARAPGVVFTHGQGAVLWDSEGRRYLDFSAGIAVNALGHGDPAWIRALTDQAARLAHVSNLYHTVPQVQLAERLVNNSFADRVFYCNSGTEANEAAIKFARKVAYERKLKEGKPSSSGSGFFANLFGKTNAIEPDLIAFTNSFHGRTMGALALTSKQKYRDPFEPVMPGATFVQFGDLDAAARAIVKGRTAAVFVEPVQGEGGCFTSTQPFLQGLRDLCDQAGALLVFDEVQCGLGRCGKLFAHELYGVQPDIMTLAKPLAGGLPIGAVLTTNRVASAMKPGDHGSTFAGNPLVCNVANTVLDRITEPGFLDGVTRLGERLRSVLRERIGSNPHVKEVRGAGLLVGVQLDCSAAPLQDACREAGLLILTAGAGDVVRLAPPLIITDQEVDTAVDIIASHLHVLDKKA